MLKVSVIGSGYVGLVSGVCFAEIGHDVLCIDNNAEKIALLKKGGCPIYEPGLEEMMARNVAAGRLRFETSIESAVQHGDAIFIAVNTPPREDGSADLSYVENAAREIAARMALLPAGSYRLIVDKSTVPVETGDHVSRTIRFSAPRDCEFDVASNPEFLREGSAVEDFLHPDRIVIGVQSHRAEEMLRQLYASIQAPLIVTDIRSAEIIKHASNSFLAAKISFINAVSRLAEEAGADIELIARGMGMDRRIGASFLNAGLGYGGSCFPKDVQAFHKIARDKGVDFSILSEVERINAGQRHLFLKKVRDALWVVKGKRIAVWGLAFKPNTDDMRSAPAIDIVRGLLGEGADVVAYDPVSMEKARFVMPVELKYAPDREAAARGADALCILTEWKEFRETEPAAIRSLLKHPIVIDGRNIFDPVAMKAHGFVYYSMGRPPVLATE
ncbi:MAG: UDP-glucose/GDP-mannose dehydrogenase family protein [Candidatus Hydrogenedentota bacterium]